MFCTAAVPNPKLVLAVAALAKSLKLFAAINPPRLETFVKLNTALPSVVITWPLEPSAVGYAKSLI